MAQRNEVIHQFHSIAILLCSGSLKPLILTNEQAVSNVLLKWHAAVVAAVGEGCIIR
jgi:hypothetical protein